MNAMIDTSTFGTRSRVRARKISGTRLRRVSERLLAAAEEPAPQEEVEQGEQ